MGRLASIERKVQMLDIRRGSSAAVQRIRGGRLDKIRECIGLRDGYTCRICGRVTAHGEVDHITPLRFGGRESDENRWWLCVDCHQKKSAKELEAECRGDI